MSTTPDDASAQITFLRTGRHRVRVQTQGSGPPLLLLMGIGGNAEMWEPLRRCLPNRRLIAFDVPGTGGSSTPWIPMTMIEIAGIAHAVLRHVGVDRTDILGVSWGGVLAQIFAIRHRSAVRRLVLAATSVGVGSVLGRPSALVDPRNASPILLATVLRQGRADALWRTHQERTGGLSPASHCPTRSASVTARLLRSGVRDRNDFLPAIREAHHLSDVGDHRDR